MAPCSPTSAGASDGWIGRTTAVSPFLSSPSNSHADGYPAGIAASFVAAPAATIVTASHMIVGEPVPASPGTEVPEMPNSRPGLLTPHPLRQLPRMRSLLLSYSCPQRAAMPE